MFGFLKKNRTEKEAEAIGAPIEGEAVPSGEVNDPSFGTEMLGKGMAIRPASGRVVSPVDGEVSMIFDTKHAVTINSDRGAQILIHVGLDTVTLKGEHFTAHVKSGQKVKKGDLLLEFDMEGIQKAGLDVITPVVICNSDDYREIRRFTEKKVACGDTVMELEK